MYFVWRYTGFAFSFADTAKAAAAAAAMGGVVWLLQVQLAGRGLSASLATLAAVAAGLAVYSVVLVALGGVSREEIAKVPVVGAKLAPWLSKIQVVKDKND